ncbi:MAG: hypothetical protein BGO01_17980 [Armatimonadetes bacterium 55-13]|nr:glycosyltransferase family 9 protein [Armatimonadota bacterium]OJU64029.1 MAG: hypothetical protein BGO01_17980 [Armatimonadetes bacterium 55-13]
MAERFLISRLSSLGDVICTLPVAAALKAGFPDSHVTWAVDPRFAGIVDCCQNVDEIVRCQPKFDRKTWPTLEGEYDAALDMQGLLKSALVVRAAKAKVKVGYHWQREGAWLFSSRVIPDPTSIHVVDQYVDVARAIGGKADFAEFSLIPKDEDLANVKTKLTEAGVQGAFVVMNGGAGWVTKRWPPSHFGNLIDSLAEAGVETVLIGGKAEDDLNVAKAIAEASQRKPKDLVGKTSVRELVALFSLAKAHVGGDTGSSHLAAALTIPAIGLYSITKPVRSCPYGQIDRCHFDSRGLSYIDPSAVAETVLAAIKS